MRTAPWALALALSGSDAQASPPPPAALVLELVDAEPVGIRVTVPASLKGPCSQGFGTLVFEGVLKKGSPLLVSTEAYRICVAQTAAPFVNVGFGPATTVYHLTGLPPVRLRVRSRGAAGVLPQPMPFVAPLVLTLDDDARIGVRIAAGTTGPCDASVNLPLFRGVLEPRTPMSFETDAMCVCFERTSAPFVTAGFGPPSIRCRPSACLGKLCQTNLAAPFEVTLRSQP